MDLARRVYSRELKLAAMRDIDNRRTLAEVARRRELSPKLLERWRGEWRVLPPSSVGDPTVTPVPARI